MHDYAHVHEDEDAYGNDYENEGQDVFDRIRVTAPVPEPELDGRAGAGGTFHQRRYTGYAPTMYRDRRNSCPTCRSILIHSGSVERCPDCAGCLVGEPVLREMVLGMTDGISEGDLEWEATEGGTPKMCPACRQAMTMVRMKDVTVDRCGEHGF